MGILAKKACNGVIKLGPPPALVAELRSWNYSGDAAELDVSTMGACESTIIGGRVTERVEGSLYLADPSDAAQALILAGARDLEIEVFPLGETIGFPKYTGLINVLNRSESGDVDGAVELNFTATTPAALTRGVAP